MKVPYSFFSKRIKELVDINELSEKFFQLGHEHTIENKIFDFEISTLLLSIFEDNLL